MYRQFRKSLSVTKADASPNEESAGSENSSGDAKQEDEEEEFDQETQDKVKNIWTAIEEQCTASKCNADKRKETQTMPGWNTVRVFVSSTFTDFFNEREVLVKKVFPELREWCESRGLKFIECDLRWGVPKDSTTAKTILICMEEIDRCMECNNDQPFFINLMGERYGWIPSGEDITQELVDTYKWVHGSSITFMEILHGAFRDTNPNAAFFLRDGAVCQEVPEEFLKQFVDTEPLARHHLKVLKRKVQERFPEKVFSYQAKFNGVTEKGGKNRVVFDDLDEFGDKVANFLKTSIDKMYPCTKPVEVDIDQQENELQWMFVVDKGKHLISRETELNKLTKFAVDGLESELEVTEGAKSSIRKAEDWDLAETDRKICVLEARSGWGKSSLLARLISNLLNNGTKVFYHIVGSTPSSRKVETLLRRFLLALLPEPSSKDMEEMNTTDVLLLQKLLRKALASYREKKLPPLVVIIDGLNELESNNSVNHLSWLPPTMPCNILCILSTNPHLPTTARIYEFPTLRMTLGPMSKEELSELAVGYLGQYSKKLDSKQLEELVSKTKVDNPLWMQLMAEELRVFGDFRLVDKRIEDFPDTMEKCLGQIIDRLISEDDEHMVIKKVLCLIACSRNGIPCDKVLQICGDIKAKEELPPLYWARARRSLKAYLRETGMAERVFTFSHEALHLAVLSCLLPTQQDLVHWHTVLADYYQFWCDHSRMKVDHLPLHLKRASLKKRMVQFMTKDPDSYTYIRQWQRSELLRDARCHSLADSVIPGTYPMMLCQFCAQGIRGFNPASTWQNKMCCVVCGHLCNTPRAAVARTCSRHSHQRGKDMVKCVLCNFTINLKAAKGPTACAPAKLCMHCCFPSEKSCAAYNV